MAVGCYPQNVTKASDVNQAHFILAYTPKNIRYLCFKEVRAILQTY